MINIEEYGLNFDSPARMTIKNFNGRPLTDAEGKSGWVDLLSLDSKKHQEFEMRITNARIEANRSGQERMTAEQVVDQEHRRYAALTVGWRILRQEGTDWPVECTEENARQVYSSLTFTFLREQVEVFVKQRANFTQARPSGS